MFESKLLKNKGMSLDIKDYDFMRNKSKCGSFEATVLKKMIPVLFEYGFLVKYDSIEKAIFLITRNPKNVDLKKYLNIIENNEISETFLKFKNLSYALVEDGFFGYSIIIVNPINMKKAIYIVKDGNDEYIEN